MYQQKERLQNNNNSLKQKAALEDKLFKKYILLGVIFGYGVVHLFQS
jgi:hypothetical protein